MPTNQSQLQQNNTGQEEAQRTGSKKFWVSFVIFISVWEGEAPTAMKSYVHNACVHPQKFISTNQARWAVEKWN